MKRNLFFLILVLFVNFSSFAVEETLVIGMEDDWNMLESESNVRFVTGTNGYRDIILSEYSLSKETNRNLVLDFNSDRISDRAGNHSVTAESIMVSTNFKKTGTGSAVFRNEKPGLKLAPNAQSMFAPGTIWDDFTIEFWLYPAAMKNGETIFLFQGSKQYKGMIVPQRIECKFENNRLSWVFDNIFLNPDQPEYSITVTGQSMLVPRNWHHHMLRFNADTGLIEYLLDGLPESIGYANDDFGESGDVFLPYIGDVEPGFLFLGIGLTAFLDEFSFSDDFELEPKLSRYDSIQGSIETEFIDLTYHNSQIIKIDADYEQPSGSAILFYYRTAESYTEIITGPSEWIQFQPGGLLPVDLTARYIQLRCTFFPDGQANITPRLSNMQITYIPDLPPLPPDFLAVSPGNGSVQLNWNSVAEEDVAGYLVYFGTKPQHYIFTSDTGLRSPVKVTGTTTILLDGLDNGQLYFFSVCSFDKSEPPHISAFSNEVSARPSALFGE